MTQPTPNPLTAALLSPSDEDVEAGARAIYGGDDWDCVWQDNIAASAADHGQYRLEAMRAFAAFATPQRRALVEDAVALWQAAGHVVTEWSERGDGGCTLALQLELTKALTDLALRLGSLTETIKGENP